jgi:ABC-type transport system involved in Fe-S cluster assembly fused permease/ATPase subunit
MEQSNLGRKKMKIQKIKSKFKEIFKISLFIYILMPILMEIAEIGTRLGYIKEMWYSIISRICIIIICISVIICFIFIILLTNKKRDFNIDLKKTFDI